MQKGKMACLIITLALVGTVFSTVILGMSVTEHEVTKFKEIADISGSFEYDKTPQYIEFDPATNYTGYYTDDTNPYFGGVDYTQTNVPAYPILQRPIILSSGSSNLDSMSLADSSPPFFDHKAASEKDYRMATYGNGEMHWRLATMSVVDYTDPTTSVVGFDCTTVQDYINQLTAGMTDSYSSIVIDLGTDDDRVLLKESTWSVTKQSYTYMGFGLTDHLSHTTYDKDRQAVKAVYSYSTNMVNLYDENELLIGSYLASNINMIYNGSGEQGTNVLDNTVQYTILQQPDPIYLDGQYGVSLQ